MSIIYGIFGLLCILYCVNTAIVYFANKYVSAPQKKPTLKK